MANDSGPPAGGAVCQARGCGRPAVLVCGRCRRVFCPRHAHPTWEADGFWCATCLTAPARRRPRRM